MDLNLVQLRPDLAALFRFAHARGLPDHDPGYLLHRALRDAFGGAAPQPFRLLEPPAAPPRLLGYGPAGEAALRDAVALAEPDLDRIFPPGEIASKPMPQRFAAGTTLGFEVRLCPLVRGKTEEGRLREQDAFLHRAQASPDEPLARETVYAAWLKDKLAAGGALLEEARMTRFSLAPLVRRSHASPGGRTNTPEGTARRLLAREGGAARRPDAVLAGRLRIDDPGTFQALLARGVGRHRAFGFGMLLLRRADG
ncbi:type I-E CRISPR-associated protein Cas6/Cse3/CasE [Marinimicrococcus flavescens]|uniref:Type I-E CRISPR-associated protein Cas6/Cse3/CasE n=1 Tax=Marinimicrococcus flavescens TaxID=3031815 RepID=A0AAP4D4V3_9PROT|nr:type I-E CRISPR-associated protein Cas6/Cse3/CasE [Marinimicrococcus flavescens]